MKKTICLLGFFFFSFSCIFSQTNIFSKVDKVQILQIAHDKAVQDFATLNDKMMEATNGYGDRSPIVKKRQEIEMLAKMLEQAKKRKIATASGQ